MFAYTFAPAVAENVVGNLIVVVDEPAGTVPVMAALTASNTLTVNECVSPIVLVVESL